MGGYSPEGIDAATMPIELVDNVQVMYELPIAIYAADSGVSGGTTPKLPSQKSIL